jgi:hypothetical protein
MQNSPRKQFSLTSFFLSFEGIFPLQFVTCIPTRFLFLFLFLFLQFEILRIKEALKISSLHIPPLYSEGIHVAPPLPEEALWTPSRLWESVQRRRAHGWWKHPWRRCDCVLPLLHASGGNYACDGVVGRDYHRSHGGAA